MRRPFVLFAIGVLALALGVLAPREALAHERRTVGNYTFIVGFMNEPALAYYPNALDLRVLDAGGQPVTGLEQTLRAEVIVGGGAQRRELELEPAFNQPGRYFGYFIPTLPGDYTFHIYGQVGGQQVDETFTSGPGRFSAAEDPAELQFPRQVPTTLELLESRSQESGGESSNDALVFVALGIGIAALAVASVDAGLRVRDAMRRQGS
ncbi:MAG: hypothetical protein NZ695_08135 [Dehalococcoidia bacterium]|jgi:hypothetical protein|nr:hypothetical protein [Dehalococcoidia bacterium]MDW8009516.1 hypothetical protein [Chloroflexota bacterium]